MPMSFPGLQDLIHAAEIWKFRGVNKDETEADYRVALADHVQSESLIESMEIRTGHGWDQFTEEESRDMVVRGIKF